MGKVSCNEIYTIPQLPGNPYCWFNALLAILFYSDESSAFFKRIIPGLRKKTKSKKRLEIYDLIDELLSAKHISNIKDFKKFYTTLQPKNLLKELHMRDKKHFYFDPNKKGTEKGYSSEHYLLMFFQFLGIHDKVLFIKRIENKYLFSAANVFNFKSFPTNKKIKLKYGIDGDAPYVLLTDTKKNPKHNIYSQFKNLDFKKYELVIVTTGLAFYKELEVPCVENKDKLIVNTSDSEQIVFKADSTLLTNFNIDTCGKAHKIAGITCNGNRYMYNGWTINKKVDFLTSCNLFEFDWIKNKLNFCFNRSKCEINEKIDHKDLCFNFQKDKTTIIFTRVHKDLKKVEAECPEGKMRNPKTGRCIKIKEKKAKDPMDVKLKDLLKKPECPEGKMMNPKTGRCINIKEKKAKDSMDVKLEDLLKKPECSEGKMRNPKTGRCIKIKEKKAKADCPEGKMRNPKTGRCIKIKK